ncbi:MFS transporter [Ferrovibrio terrae]|uniref:MFS transporter n=1 Tax=Ferrovibrio terrae TaxID=2594003 RepID=A0A516H030_9PROT|nr:MFS transporter [Ferrovibrio terrae]QDO97129.1 MFS transporter [Ferrovibrio terrae]
MLAMAALSLGLLVYIGWSEARRTYTRFQVDKMVTQGELVLTAMDTYLRAGLPVGQFPGFRQIADSIRESDPAIAAIAVHDLNGRAIFLVGNTATPYLSGHRGTHRFQVYENESWLQVALPLSNRFETIGELRITMPREAVTGVVNATLPQLVTVAASLALLFGLFAFRVAGRTSSSATLWIGAGYVLTFVITTVVVVIGLLTLYEDGAQAKAQALAKSLAQRVEPVLTYGLAIEDFEGLDRMLLRYRQLNPDIKAVSMILNGTVVVSSDPTTTGQTWRSDEEAYEYVVPLMHDASASEIRVIVALPVAIVSNAVLRGVRNFGALFVGSVLVATLLLGVAQALGSRSNHADARQLALIRPIFFISVFCEYLPASFWPQLLQTAAAEYSLGRNAASLAFATYFAVFLLSLLPTSAWVSRHGPRNAIVCGALLVGLASLLPAMSPDFPTMLMARAIAGLGQGILFISVQAAVLASVPANERTRGAAVIVFGFNAGMIAGAAIGSLLVNDLSANGVFAVGAITAGLLAVYAAWSAAVVSARSTAGAGFRQMLRDVPRAFASLGFLRALLLIGAPSKALLTGAIGFATPLLLSGLGWAAEDIGQVIMLYAGGVLLASGPVARFVDRTGRSGATLVAGGLVSAISLFALGSIGLWLLPPLLEAGVIVGGVFLLGLAHGCINAPIITYVGTTGAAEQLGVNGATALYRMVERVGHAMGPILAGQLLLVTSNSPVAWLWMGGVMLACTLLFALPTRTHQAGAGK